MEMGLRLRWDVPNIFEYFIDVHPELRLARDHLFSNEHQPTLEEKIQLGQMFDRLLDKDRRNCAAKVEEIMAPCCFEIAHNALHDEQEVLNLACLIGRDQRAQFEAGVFAAARLFDDHYAFDYSGPWAPHHFVDVALAL
jgi:hypothetical protein